MHTPKTGKQNAHQCTPFCNAMKNTVKTAEEARAEFERKGLSIAAWARKHKVGRSLVYEVLAGRKKCHRGKSHKVAVLLGMKQGEIVEDHA